MQITETLAEGLKHEFKVVIGADDMEQRLTARLSDLAKEVRMPGFRPGKVPVPVLRRTHGKYVLGEVLEQTVSETTTQALEERELKPAMQPRIEVTQFEEGKALE